MPVGAAPRVTARCSPPMAAWWRRSTRSTWCATSPPGRRPSPANARLGSRQPMASDWRERTVDRSLANHRARALEKSSRFIDAATELLAESGRTDFTVQEIVDRSGQSVRAFYQHFAGKDDLLLAVFEQAMETFAHELRR